MVVCLLTLNFRRKGRKLEKKRELQSGDQWIRLKNRVYVEPTWPSTGIFAQDVAYVLKSVHNDYLIGWRILVILAQRKRSFLPGNQIVFNAIIVKLKSEVLFPRYFWKLLSITISDESLKPNKY